MQWMIDYMKKIGLTIIIPCYNSMDTIENSLDSILNNVLDSYDVEIIVIDDYSKDDTFLIAEKYSIDNTLANIEIKLLRNKCNMGAGETRNIGVGYATKEYITFLDSDDAFSSDFFSSIFDRLIRCDDVIVFDALHKFDESKIYMNMFFSPMIKEGLVDPKKALVYMNGSTCGKIYNSLLVKEHGVKFGNTSRMEDLVFSKTAISFAEHIYYIRKPLYIYNNNLNSLTNDFSLLGTEKRMSSFDEIQHKIDRERFRNELNSVFFLEVIYMLVMNKIRVGEKTKEIRRLYKKYIRLYDKNDKYMRGYRRQYKIAYYLFELGLFDVVRFFIYLKNKGK